MRTAAMILGPTYRARGAALMIAIFAMVIVSGLVVIALDVATTDMAITRNTLSLSKALYVADAGVQHALAMLRADRAWRTGFSSPGVELPSGSGSVMREEPRIDVSAWRSPS